MGIGSLSKPVQSRVIGIDASTNSLAFAVFEDGKPITCGEVEFVGATVEERLGDAAKKVTGLVESGILVGDYVAIEAAVFVNNRQVVIKLAYVFGAIMGVLMQHKVKVIRVPPIEWQTGIGNPNLTKAEKEQMKKDNCGKSATWIKNESRRIRKQRTMDIANRYFTVPGGSDNVSDAIGVALYVSQNLVRSK